MVSAIAGVDRNTRNESEPQGERMDAIRCLGNNGGTLCDWNRTSDIRAFCQTVTTEAPVLSLEQQLFLDLLFPPVGASVWWLMSTGWAMVMQGGKISERTKAFRKTLFWALLVGAYALMFAVTVYSRLTK